MMNFNGANRRVDGNFLVAASPLLNLQPEVVGKELQAGPNCDSTDQNNQCQNQQGNRNNVAA
jgi:hypothetical protein